jgi:hypothetical protein
MSNSSRHSSQPPEDWEYPESTIHPSTANSAAPTRVSFPSHDGADDSSRPDVSLPSHGGSRTGSGKRTLSDLLKVHAEKGTNVHFTPEEATRLGEVLGQWVRVRALPSLPSLCNADPYITRISNIIIIHTLADFFFLFSFSTFVR